MKKNIKVFIIDDSALVRKMLTAALESDQQIKVIGTAPDPFIAVKKLKKEKPDVITLDIEMPKMDGLTFLEKLMKQSPMPVVICSSLTLKNSQTALKAIEHGAVDIITKPSMGTKQFFEESKITICDTVKAASMAKINSILSKPQIKIEKISSGSYKKAMIKTTEKIVVIGASTGGTKAVEEILVNMPENAPGIVCVLHMPENFTRSYAQRLNNICKISVKEADSNDVIIPGRALIAPGGLNHTIVQRSGAKYFVKLKSGPLVNRHRPSVDILFKSTARYAGSNAVGVILTGMGDDGAKGLKEMKDAGSYTIGQDEKTSIVYGMPKEAYDIGAVNIQLPLHKITKKIIEMCSYI